MTRRLGALLLAIGILCGTCAWAQTDAGTPDTGAPTQPGPKPAFTYPDATPSLDFLNGSIENSSITLGINAGFSYVSDTYGALTTSNQDRWLVHIAPDIKIQQFLPHLAWHASYSGGYQYYTQISGVGVNYNNNLFSQRAGGGFLWQMARRWQLMGDDNYTFSANPFDSYVSSVGTPTLNNPNPVAYYPLTQYTSNRAILTLTDQLSKTDTLAFTGTANLRNTSTYNLLSAVPFYNLISYGGRASYSHQLSARLSLGADYDYNTLDFGHGQQRSGIQTIQMTGSYLLKPNMTISGWLGPQYTSTKDTLGVPIAPGEIVYVTQHSSLWSTSFGANFGWQSLRNSVRVGFSRQVLDGGGILATSQVNSIDGSYRRRLSSKMDCTVGGRYYHDTSTTVSSRSFDNYYINTGLTYRFSKSLQTTGLYSYLHQDQSNTILIGNAHYSTNLVGVTIAYSWTHPLGR
ncbi:MAG TPA: hypothetical protein VE779_03240 [Candidatus Angelobacter sp.]|nr:hypothetical protein [Candidatus Angelobacter sp.]